MDKILLKNMTFHAYHGEFQVEGQFGQIFDVDVELFLDTRPAGKSDDINDTVNFYDVYEEVEDIILRGDSYNLIEAIANAIAARLLKRFELLNDVLVRVRKNKAPVKGLIDYAEVEIKRCRADVS